jgi:hypothetical protein
MKKGKVNPDRYKIPGGAPLDEKLEKRRTRLTSESPNQTSRPTKNRTAVAGTAKPKAAKKREPGATRSSGGQTNQQMSQKTGKRSGAQKDQATRYGTEAIPATRPIEGAFGREPTQRNRREIP